MIGRIVERRKAVPVAFDLGAVSNVKTDRSENLFDTHPGANHGVNAAAGNRSARKRHIDGFRSKLGLHDGLSELFAASVQKRFHLSLCLVDGRAAFTLLFGREAR